MDRGKLARILGMLGSQHDGEVVAAARAASRMLADANVTWSDLATGVTVIVKAAEPRPEAQQAAQEARREPEKARGRQYQRREANPAGPRTRTHRGINAGELVRWLRNNRMSDMTLWEQDFTASLLLFSQDPALSPKQWERLWETAKKAGAFPAETAA